MQTITHPINIIGQEMQNPILVHSLRLELSLGSRGQLRSPRLLPRNKLGLLLLDIVVLYGRDNAFDVWKKRHKEERQDGDKMD